MSEHLLGCGSRRAEGLLGLEVALPVGLLGVGCGDDGPHLLVGRGTLAGAIVADLGDEVVRRPVAREDASPRGGVAPGVVLLELVDQLALDLAEVAAALQDDQMDALERLVQAGQIGVVLDDGREHLTRLSRTSVVTSLDGVLQCLGEGVGLGLGDVGRLADLGRAVAQGLLVVNVLAVEQRLAVVALVDGRVPDEEDTDHGRDHQAENAPLDVLRVCTHFNSPSEG